jgi:hypothetical protein
MNEMKSSNVNLPLAIEQHYMTKGEVVGEHKAASATSRGRD